MTRVGIGIQKSIENPEAFRSIPWSDVLILSPDLHLLPQVRELAPQAKILVRFYDPDVMAESPEQRAEEFCGLLAAQFGDKGVDAIPANELDLEGEHSGQGFRTIRGTIALWDNPDALIVIASWLSDYANAHRRLRPQDTLHLPACSGAMDRYTYWATMPSDKYDILDGHWYTLDYMPDPGIYRPFMVTEWNGPDRSLYIPFLKSLGDIPNAYFLWSSPDPEFAKYEIYNDSDLLKGITDLLLLPVAGQEGTDGAARPPVVDNTYWGAGGLQVQPNNDGGNMMADNKSVYDWFMKGLGGPGYNPATALGKLRKDYPELGMMVGGEEDFTGSAGTFRCQRYTGGIAWAEVDNWEHQGVAYTEAELPF